MLRHLRTSIPILVSLVVPFLGLSGCAKTTTTTMIADGSKDPDAAKLGDKDCVAIFPFDNLTNYPEAGRIMADLMANVFYRSGKFRIMERGEIERIATASKVSIPARLPLKFARVMGEALDVELALTGSVTEFNYLDSVTGNPGVGFSVQLMDLSTGQILWAASHVRTSSDQVRYRKDPLSRIALLSADSISAPFFAAVPSRGTDTSIVCGNSDAIIPPLSPDGPREALFVKEGSFGGRTVLRSGAALGSVTLEFPDRGLSRVLTDPDTGSFRLENLEPGTLQIVASKDGYATKTFEAQVESGKMTMLDLALVQERKKTAAAIGTITGRILDSGGKPVEAIVLVTNKGATVSLKANSGGDGKFSFDVAPDSYTVRVVAKGFVSQSKTLKVTKKGKVILNVNLRPERTL